jgi:hypothetical protein
MRLSYSEYKDYKACPKCYHNRVNNVEPPAQMSKYFALYGLLIELFFKHYTNNFIKRNLILSDDQTRIILRKLWDKVLKETYVIWDDPWVKESSEHIFLSVHEDIKRNLDKFSFWKNAQAEVSYEIILKKTQDILSCRMDFVVNNHDGTVEILDGKGTYKMDKSVDIEQLYFYALIYLLHHKKLPNRIGFLYYKFQTITYIDFDQAILMDFRDKLAMVKKALKEDKIFEARVGISKQCKWCEYQITCEALINKRKERSAKKNPIVSIDFNGEILDF